MGRDKASQGATSEINSNLDILESLRDGFLSFYNSNILNSSVCSGFSII